MHRPGKYPCLLYTSTAIVSNVPIGNRRVTFMFFVVSCIEDSCPRTVKANFLIAEKKLLRNKILPDGMDFTIQYSEIDRAKGKYLFYIYGSVLAKTAFGNTKTPIRPGFSRTISFLLSSYVYGLQKRCFDNFSGWI